MPDFDCLVAGFPCQPFSIAGKQEGFRDSKGRGNMFFELERIFKAKKPQIMFFENVKNLVSHDSGNTLKTILEILGREGYYVKYKVLNASNYGVPQNRERIYIVCFKDKTLYEKFSFPKEIKLDKTPRDLFEKQVPEKYYYKKEKCCFYDELEKSIINPNSIYQWRRNYVRENKSNVCPTLTAAMGTGGNNVPLILSNNRIRKLTPTECIKFQGFPQDFKLPNQSDTRLYKQAGNSVCVPVIYRIAEQIKEVYLQNENRKDLNRKTLLKS